MEIRRDEQETTTIRFIIQTTDHSIFKQPYEIYVVGNINELGQWNPKEGLKMKRLSPERLEAQIKIPKNLTNTLEYKYVNITTNDGQINWENGENRLIHKIDSSFIQIQDQYRDAVPSIQPSEELIAIDRVFGRTHEQKINLAVPPIDMVLARFFVKAGLTKPRHQIAVSGSCPQLNNWSIDNPLIMQYTYPHWELDVYVPRDLFPIEYKYVYDGEFNWFEVGSNNRIDLSNDNADITEYVVQVNDVFRGKTNNYHGITVPVREVEFSIYSCKLQKNVQSLLDYAYLEDNKLVVSHFIPMNLAGACQKPIKRIERMRSFSLHGNSAEFNVAKEALANPDSSITHLMIEPNSYFFDDETVQEVSAIIKRNKRISTIELNIDPSAWEDYVDWNTDWLFDAITKDEFPNVKTLLLDNEISLDRAKEIIRLNKYITTFQWNVCSEGHNAVKELCDALMVNTTLTSLYIKLEHLDAELLERTIASRRQIKNFRLMCGDGDIKPFIKSLSYLRKLYISQSRVSEEVLLEFLEALKHSETIASFVLEADTVINDMNRLNATVESLLETNWNLMNFCVLYDNFSKQSFVNDKCQRNREYQIERHMTIVVLIHNIARSTEALLMLPKEVWLLIFSMVEIPIYYDYHALLHRLLQH